MGWTEAVSHEAPRLSLRPGVPYWVSKEGSRNPPPLVCPKEDHTASSPSSLAETWGSSCFLLQAVSSLHQSRSGLWLGHLSPYPLRLQGVNWRAESAASGRKGSTSWPATLGTFGGGQRSASSVLKPHWTRHHKRRGRQLPVTDR